MCTALSESTAKGESAQWMHRSARGLPRLPLRHLTRAPEEVREVATSGFRCRPFLELRAEVSRRVAGGEAEVDFAVMSRDDMVGDLVDLVHDHAVADGAREAARVGDLLEAVDHGLDLSAVI